MNSSQDMLNGLMLAIVLGTIGQCVRVIAGLKKQADDSAANGVKFANDFSGVRLGLTLAMGATAGATAFLTFWFGGPNRGVDLNSASVVFGIMAAGYSGADFVEAFVRKHLPGSAATAQVAGKGGASSAAPQGATGTI